MSEKDDLLMRAINDARALLDTLLSSGWQDIHVVSEETEIFIAREGGRPNPMRHISAPPPLPASSASTAAVTSLAGDIVYAPHVATIVDILPVGTAVVAGDRIATIQVLDEEDVVVAPEAGLVTAIHTEIGALVEYKTPIVSLSGASR